MAAGDRGSSDSGSPRAAMKKKKTKEPKKRRHENSWVLDPHLETGTLRSRDIMLPPSHGSSVSPMSLKQ